MINAEQREPGRKQALFPRLLAPVALFLFACFASAPAYGNVITTFKLVGFAPFPVTGHFTYDFTLGNYTDALFVFPGGVTSNGNVFTSPVSISTTTLSAAANSGTLGYDMQFNFATPLTPTTGSLVATDPPGTPINNLTAFVTQDNNGVPNTSAITSGSIVVVPEPIGIIPVLGGLAVLLSWRSRS